MKKLYNALVILLILSLLLFSGFGLYESYTKFDYSYTYRFSHQQPTNRQIPKVIMQTYHKKSKIPNKVYENIKKYAPDYKHIIYDDKECIEFLEQFDKTFQYIKNQKFKIVYRFKSYRKGAHKADLFRYCYLYQYGGIYLDIKTELIKPLNELINQDNTLYTVIGINKKSIYQGIVCVYPEHPIIGELINQCVNANHFILNRNYDLFLEFFYMCIMEDIKGYKIIPGKHDTHSGYKIYLFQEDHCPKSDCGTLDRYGFCTFIHDENGKKVIKTRYSDFPW